MLLVASTLPVVVAGQPCAAVFSVPNALGFVNDYANVIPDATQPVGFAAGADEP